MVSIFFGLFIVEIDEANLFLFRDNNLFFFVVPAALMVKTLLEIVDLTLSG